jgi:hypothetical protein
MPNRLDLPSVVLTIVMIIVSIWVWWAVMMNNAEYGDTVRLLTIIWVVLTFTMLAGCIIKYYGLTQEDLESMGDVKR